MVVTCMPNSGHGGPPGTWVMTIFVFYVGPHFSNIQYFDVCGGICRYKKLFGGIWRYMDLYEGRWRYIRIYAPTFSTLFFQHFGCPLFRHCFVSTGWGSTFSTLFFFSFFKGLQALGGISYFFLWNFTSNGVLNIQKGWILVHAMTWRGVLESSRGFLVAYFEFSQGFW